MRTITVCLIFVQAANTRVKTRKFACWKTGDAGPFSLRSARFIACRNAVEAILPMSLMTFRRV